MTPPRKRRFLPLALALLFLAGCGGETIQTDAGTVSGNDATTVYSIKQVTGQCIREHEGLTAIALPGNEGYGATSAVVAVCHDGTVLAVDD